MGVLFEHVSDMLLMSKAKQPYPEEVARYAPFCL